MARVTPGGKLGEVSEVGALTLSFETFSRPERAVVHEVVGQDLLGDALVSLRLVLLDETADDRLVVHGCASSRGPEGVRNRGWAGSATSRDATCAGRRAPCRRSGTSGSTSPRRTRRRRAAACRRSAGT